MENKQKGTIRNSIDQGFIRAELASIADKQLKVYEGAHATGTVAIGKVTNAIENYKAAVSCFVRALPGLTDERSAKLVRDEIRRLLARLGELEVLAKQVDPDHASTEAEFSEPLDVTRNRVLADPKYSVGDSVCVDDTKLGTITGVDEESGTYTVQYKDGSEERNVLEPRISLPLQGDAELFRIWSEIVESERAYLQSMKQLVHHYLIPLDSPAQWIGQKQDTVFTQKTLTEEERKQIFGNVEDLAGTSEIVFNELSAAFEKWNQDQNLAKVFLAYSQLYLGPYEEYADAFYSSMDFLAKVQKERGGFAAVEMQAERQFGAPKLAVLMKLPLERPAQCKVLLRQVFQRTSPSHPDYHSIQEAYVMFSRVEQGISNALNRVKLEKQVLEVEKVFNPPIALAKKNRFLLLHCENLKRMENATAVERAVWLFTDLVVVARKSEWFAVGQYRVLHQLKYTRAKLAPEFGPFAFELSNSSEKSVFVARNAAHRQEWLHALRGRLVDRKEHAVLGAATQKLVLLKKRSSRLPPPPPPEAERWVRARAKFTFESQCGPGDLPFKKGDDLEVQVSTGGWGKGRKNGNEGNVPLNFLELL